MNEQQIPYYRNVSAYFLTISIFNLATHRNECFDRSFIETVSRIRFAIIQKTHYIPNESFFLHAL